MQKSLRTASKRKLYTRRPARAQRARYPEHRRIRGDSPYRQTKSVSGGVRRVYAGSQNDSSADLFRSKKKNSGCACGRPRPAHQGRRLPPLRGQLKSLRPRRLQASSTRTHVRKRIKRRIKNENSNTSG